MFIFGFVLRFKIKQYDIGSKKAAQAQGTDCWSIVSDSNWISGLTYECSGR